MKRVTISVSEEAFERAVREAEASGMTVPQFVAWLVESYEPPSEPTEDAS